MLGDETIAALLAIWDEELSGERWAELRRALCQLVDQFQQSADDEARAEITMHITDLLRDTDLDLYRKLIAMRRAIRASTAQNRFSTRGMPSGEELAAVWQEIRAHEGETRSDGDGAGTQATAQRDDEPRFIRYTDISCPRYAQVGERITLTVALTMQQQAESVVKQAVHVSAGEVKVRLSAPGFELLSPAEQTVIIEPDADSAPVVFHLKGRTEGQHEIAVQFWQRGNLIATAFVPIEIVAIQPVFAPAIIPSIPVNARLGDARPPDLTLVVNHAPNGHTEFIVIGDGVVHFATQTMLAFEPRAFIQHVYKEIGLLQRGYDSVNEPRALATDQIERRIRTLGHLLWDRLIPPDLKAFYSRERARWRVEDARDRRWSLLVQSNEADIPWELVRPYGEGDDQWEEGFWCETFYFARWLLKRPDTLTGYAPPPRLRLRALAAIVPTCYPELRAVPDEHALLRDLIARHRLADRSPARATEAAVVDLLEQGGFDWMHIVTHGAFLAESVLHSGALALEDRQWLACSVITGPRIRGKLHAERPAFILNACHAGRSAPMLSGASNWATHLIGSGAGMLIAPLWSVNDALATEFSRAYYDALLNRSQPATLAEAVWHARAAIRRPDEPTWLAYSLFAHPNATVTVTNEGG